MNLEDKFASAYNDQFISVTNGLSFNEVPLFRAMRTSLIGLSSRFSIEEYHGGAHQVRFTGNGSFARSRARCELSDLLIITYSPIRKVARLTFLQAKSERATLSAPSKRKFSANLEQWLLLSSRPSISGVGKSFNPPADLLSSALLGSVGSFGFFYKDQMGDFQTLYASADYLRPGGKYSQRYGTLETCGPCIIVNTSGYRECRAASGNASFAKSLYALEIGTPVGKKIKKSAVARTWLEAALSTLIRPKDQSQIVEELIDVLEPNEKSDLKTSFGAKSLIIIRSNSDQ